MKIAALLFSIVFTPLFAGDGSVPLNWIDAKGISCYSACRNHKMTPVMSGIYINNKPYFICATNIGNEGDRPGFNIPGFNSGSCGVSYGPSAHYEAQFRCLCQKATDPRIDALEREELEK